MYYIRWATISRSEIEILPFISFDDTIRKVISSGSSILHTIGYLIPGPDTKTPPIPYVQVSYFSMNPGYFGTNWRTCIGFFAAILINVLQSRITNFISWFKCTMFGECWSAWYSGVENPFPVGISIATWRSLPSIFWYLSNGMLFFRPTFFNSCSISCSFFVLLFSILVAFHWP